ncbi:hypothetical protein AB0G54_33380 [Streptomyces yokosukanensis]|uniref:hypothetical protein n=1 Tax=Streptomyces yokosukanensis TaxID=67386 RepID=UPI00342E5EF9
MPADEVTRGTDVDGSRVRTGPRHAAPRKPLFTRFHMPAGKAIASVAMPTAVLMGMGFTSTLALADGGSSPSPSTTSKSLTADEYKDCVKALDGSKDASSSPSPSASQSTSGDSATPTPSASADAKDSKTAKDSTSGDSGKTSSSDSGADDKASPKPTATSGSSGSDSGSGSSSSGDSATPSPSASKSGGGLLDTIGDTLGGILGVGKDSASASASPSPSASASSDAAASSSGTKLSDAVKGTASTAGKAVDDTVKKTTDTVKKATDTVKKTTDSVSKTAKDTVQAAGSATPSPSAGSAAPADCPKATDDEGGVDNKVPVADDPWHLDASSLLLKGADYQGIVEVKTASGTTKKVLKYVISGGTDIGDLHQTVDDKLSGKTYHVQASKGSTSTIRGGDTTMYTQSISGNLFGLIPMTFTPDSPPPLNLPLIYFTNVKVVQAAQFGGNLHVPGMHVYTTG